MQKLSIHKADFAKNMEVPLNVLNGLDSSKFSVILNSNTAPDKFFHPRTFKHLSFARKLYLT